MSDYSFPADLQPYVDEMLKSGRYEHVSELVLEAVYLHRDAELTRQRKHEELKKEIQIGIDQLNRGQVAPLDMDAIMARARKHISETQESR
jgi:antitoxin ParD1/3/4